MTISMAVGDYSGNGKDDLVLVRYVHEDAVENPGFQCNQYWHNKRGVHVL